MTPTRWILAALAGLAGACATSPQGGSEGAAEAHAADRAAIEDLGEMADPFILTISAERSVVLIGLARAGAAAAAGAGTASGEAEADELARATRATIAGARELYLLRDEVCRAGLVAVDRCGALPPPAWLGAPFGEVADVVEINRRIEWLETAMEPFVDAGCAAGEARSDDGPPHFCSVE